MSTYMLLCLQIQYHVLQFVKITVMCSDPECTQWGYKTRGQIHARARHSKSAAKSKVKGGAKKAQSATEYQHCTLFINENFKVL